MATVYQRLTENLKNRPSGFMLIPFHRNLLGIQVAKIFREQGKGEVELVTSIEGKQSFTVANYPDSFTPIIDETIKSYYKDLFTKAKAKKDARQAQNKTDSAPKKVRTRKPLQKEKQPVYRANLKK